MYLHKFEVPGLAHNSYLLSSQGKAVLVDPKRDVDTYVQYASAHNLSITHILETHIHADYASGARELAQATGGELWLSGHDHGEEYSYAFPHHGFHDGEELKAGSMRLAALHTPGHTPEHLSFVVYDDQRSSEVPMALLSGDFVFVGSLGRPDLLGDGAKKRLASELFRSVHQRLAGLPDGIELHPAHGAGSLCGSGMSERQQSTLGYERACNPFFKELSAAEFAQKILGSVPPLPDYYKRMKRMNAQGPKLLGTIPGNTSIGVQSFKEHANQTDSVVLDLRRPEAFGGAHIPGSYNIGAGQNLSMWAAWVLPYDRSIFLVGEESTDYEQAARSLVRVGLDEVRGYLKGGMAAWIEAGLNQAHIPQISVEELHSRTDRPFVLDVTSDGEWNSGHIEGAKHIMAGDVAENAGSLPGDREIHLICGSGYRSSIAASVLRKAGVSKIVNVVGGMGAWKRREFPVVKSEAICTHL
ncbi:MAG TPA: MBL fold metallo-hydrolase [Candidatus Acidoferrum sp.]|nr:MBL fold metallo-hydrolase [Candidatus Acidoferrum sp.]